MRTGIKIILATLLGVPLMQMFAHADDQPTFKDEKDKASYAVGMSMGTYLKRGGFEVNMDTLMAGIKDAAAGGETKLTAQQMQETIMAYQQAMQGKLAEKNHKEGEAFLAENKKKEGVNVHSVTLPDGTTAEFQYKIITKGTTNAIPKSNDIVTVNYRGTLINGKEFDSSAKHGGPAQFQLNRVIRGWSEALQLMKVGSKCVVYLPSSLAYKDNGSGTDIEPGAALVFEVELMSILPPKPPGLSGAPATSDIIRVPSAAEMKAGAQVQVIKPEDLEKTNSAQSSGSNTNKN